MTPDWTLLKLSDLSLKITKGTTPTLKEGGFADTGINYIKAESIGFDGRIDQSKFSFISESTHEKLKRSQLQIDDILFSMAGVNLGKTGIVEQKHVPANTNQALALIRPNVDMIFPKYLFYFLRQASIVQYVNSSTSQSAQPNINLKEIGDLEISFPDLKSQAEIAEILSSLDDKIELNRQTNQTLEQIAQALFKSWFVDFEPTRAKIAAKEAGASPEEIERAAMCAISGKTPNQLAQLPPETQQNLKTTAALFPDALVDSELGEVPDGWEVGGLKDCCIRVESGGTPSRNESLYWNGGIKWLSSGEVRDVIALNTKETISLEGLNNSSAKLWPIGTTVVAMYGATAGQVCMLANEMSANQACCALIPKAISRCYLFLTARLSVDELLGKASGSAQQNLNKSLVADHRILLPSDSILELFENSVTSLIGTWVKNTEQNLVLTETRDSLLPKLLSGEIQL